MVNLAEAPYTVPCPKCGAPARSRCISTVDAQPTAPHTSRDDDATD